MRTIYDNATRQWFCRWPGLHTRPCQRRGFTLTELMVSVAILLLMLTMVGTIFSMATKASSKATANNEIMNNFRALEGQLRQDFRNIPDDAFMAIWYQLKSVDDPENPGRDKLVRSDRIVFFTAGQHIAHETFAAPNGPHHDIVASGDPNASPLEANMARVFYGHGELDLDDPGKWTLTRRAKLLRPDILSSIAYSPPFDPIADSESFSTEEYEPVNADDWQLPPLLTLDTIFGTISLFSKDSDISWFRRPLLDNDHLTKIISPDCSMFKVQRWIEYHPISLTRDLPDTEFTDPHVHLLPSNIFSSLYAFRNSETPHWWPEENFDGDDVANEGNEDSDFIYAMNHPDGYDSDGEYNICEYFNGPKPDGTWGEDVTPWDKLDSLRWYYYDQLPKKIKITVQLHDPNQRLKDGQTLTMVFDVGAGN